MAEILVKVVLNTLRISLISKKLQKDWKSKLLKNRLGKRNPKCLNRIAKISCGHLCLKEENLNFDNNSIIYNLQISIITISDKP